MPSPPPADPARAAKRKPRTITATYLEKAALHYLERFSASAALLRRVLARRVEKARREGGEVPPDAAALVEAAIARCVRLGLVDDRRFAEGKAVGLRRRGASARQIAAKLRLAGIDPDTVDGALAAAAVEMQAEAGEEAELRAALRLAERRRIGPYRPAGERAAQHRRDLATLARAGFSLAVARRVLDAPDPDSLLGGG